MSVAVVEETEDSNPSTAYTITYNANNGTNEKRKVNVNIEESTSLLDNTTFSRTNFVLKSWNTAPDGTGTRYELGENITPVQNIQLYAQWIQSYSVDLNDYSRITGTVIFSDSTSYGASLEMLLPKYWNSLKTSGDYSVNSLETYSIASADGTRN